RGSSARVQKKSKRQRWSEVVHLLVSFSTRCVPAISPRVRRLGLAGRVRRGRRGRGGRVLVCPLARGLEESGFRFDSPGRIIVRRGGRFLVVRGGEEQEWGRL